MAAPQKTWAQCDAELCKPGTIFEVEEAVIDGRKTRYWKNAPRTFRDLLYSRLTNWANEGRQFLSTPSPLPSAYESRDEVSYAAVLARSIELAAWLRDQGVTVGTRVGLGGLNSEGWVESFFAIELAGAVPVMLNSTLQPEIQDHCLSLTKPLLVLVSQEMSVAIAPLVEKLQTKGVGKFYCWDRIHHLPAEVQKVVGSFYGAVGSPASIKAIESGKGLESLGPESDATILFTSGTTSLPKAVLSTQRQALHHLITSQIIPARAVLRAGGTVAMAQGLIAPPEVQQTMLFAVPMFHVTGLLSMLLRSVDVGNRLVFIRRWNVKEVIGLIKRYNVNVISGVPTIVQAALQAPELEGHEMAGLLYGGGPPPQRMVQDIKKKFPTALAVHAWGMTETNAVAVAFMGDDYLNNPEAVGPPIPICDVKVVDQETKKELPRGTFGLLLVRGGNVMKEYLNNPKATKEALDADGWLDTGDMAIHDEEGLVYIRDRAKDVIIRGGENIASQEVENEVYKDDRIAEATAIAVPCDIHGERVGVAVSLAPGATATAESILDKVEPLLRHPARPAILVVSDAPLPRNANGKFVKFEIAKMVREIWEKQGRKEVKRRARL
ncbi:Putative acyl-CoA synthetase YngI [Vanrija pseudolonga]|uniref:Acyl-CoA synthetase YngI n=1 Tax=Vanrija pseudolonga TaxID=143232 RepID=A0AAF0YCU8_9TREE|nr:Putative acyl-CoA synthetase YngI [Vanrija pseudolonga]